MPLLSKQHSIEWEDHLRRIQFFLEFFSSSFFFWPWDIFCILTKIHWQGCWNCNPCILRNLLRNTEFFLKNILIWLNLLSRTSAKFFWALGKKSLDFWPKKAGLSKLYSFCQQEVFYGKQLSSKVFLIFGYVRYSCDDLLFYRGKKSLEFVKAAFNVSTETFWQKPSTFEESLNLCFFFILLSNDFPRGCQNYLIRVQRTVLRCPNGTISALNSDFEQKIFELLSIKFYHCSQNRIQYVGRINCGKFCFFLEFLQFHIFFDLERNCFGIFGKKLSTGLWEVFSVCLQEIFKSIKFLGKPFFLVS